ncbi:hypothetical protein [Acetobacter phage phiAX1]|nr:hypothetical protein [Acetobacter phage phiAX1]
MSFNERLKLTVVFEDEAVGYCTDYYPEEYPSDGNVQFVTVQEAERGIAEAVAAEREKSAKMCDGLVTIMNALVKREDDPAFYEGASMALSMFAKAARSNFSADAFNSIRSAAK